MFMTGQGAEFAAAEISGPSTHGESHADLVAGLLATPAGVSPKYFYDARGSELFTDITSLPEYYPTRTEQHIMQTHGSAMAQQLGRVKVANRRAGVEHQPPLDGNVGRQSQIGRQVGGQRLHLDRRAARLQLLGTGLQAVH